LIAIPFELPMLPVFMMFKLLFGFTTIAVPELRKIDPLFTKVPPVLFPRNAANPAPVTAPELVTVALLPDMV